MVEPKRDKPRISRKRRSRDFWLNVIEQWQQSGLTQLDFCQKHALGRSTFHRWRSRFKSENASGATLTTPDFIALEVAVAPELPAADDLEVMFPSHSCPK